MSALTKLFVVLLIVCSLLMTAATVVFVNRTEDFAAARKADDARIARLTYELQTEKNHADAASKRETEGVSVANARITDLQNRIQTLTKDLADKDVENNRLAAAGAVDKVTISNLTAGVQAAQDNIASISKRNESLVAENDQLRARQVELAGANTDYAKRLDSADRELRHLNEQVIALKARIALLGGDAADAVASNRPTPTIQLPDVRGAVREVRKEGGITYAVINLGTADKIARGMELQVVDPTSQTWMGKFIVDNVDTDRSFGRLEGPRVQQVKADHLVISKL